MEDISREFPLSSQPWSHSLRFTAQRLIMLMTIYDDSIEYRGIDRLH